MTPSLMISASKLLGNIGLQPNATMTSAMTTISINGLVNNYSNLQPGTTNGNTLSARGWTVTNLNLPLYIANANTTISNVSAHYNKILPNIGNGLYDITKFTAILLQAKAFVTASLATQTMLETFYNQTFDDLGISVTNHSSAVANGLSNIFGTDAQMATLSNGIRRFGTAYNIKNLNKLGDPATFIQNLINHGFSENGQNGVYLIGGNVLSATWRTDDASTLLTFLSNIKGDTLNKIIDQTGLTPNSTITDLSQLLDLSKIFNSAELAVVPGNNFAGLANEFVNLGGEFKSFTEVADLLNNIEVPTLTYLDGLTDIISDSDYANLSASIGTGTGSLGNPTITDVMGSIAGVTHSTALTTISNCLTTALSSTEGTLLNETLANVITQCTAGTKTSTVTFSNLQTGNVVTVAGLTFTANANTTAANVATIFSNLAPSSIIANITSSTGSLTGNLTSGFSSQANVTFANVIFNSSVNVANIVVSTTGSTPLVVSTVYDIDSGFANLWSAANTFNITTALSTTATTGNSAVTTMQSQVITELNNLTLAGISLDDIPPAGVNGILSTVNNLHNYGVDNQGLNYTTLFEGCRQSNAGGDAIHAALVEGRNLLVQSQHSVMIGTKYKK